jgi:hypothetical protein
LFLPIKIPDSEEQHKKTQQEFHSIIIRIGHIVRCWEKPAQKYAQLIQRYISSHTAGKIRSTQSGKITQGVPQGLCSGKQQHKNYDLLRSGYTIK